MKVSSLVAVVGFAVSLPSQGWFKAPLVLDANGMRLAGDLDGDGDIDVVRAVGLTAAWSAFEVMRNQGGGVLVAAGQFPVNAGPVYASVMADVDGDGHLDVVLSVYGGPSFGRGLLIYPGLGGAAFSAPIHIATTRTVDSLVVGKANSDAIADVGFVQGLFAADVGWLFGNANRQFVLQPTLQLAATSYLSSLVVLDLNGDGLDDLAGVNGATVQLLPTLAGVPTLGIALPAPSLLIPQLLAADFDGDLDRDLVLADFRGTSCNLTRFTNQGGGAFAATTQTFANPTFGRFHAGDWDGDGDADLMLRGGSNSGLGFALVQSVGSTFVWTWVHNSRLAGDGENGGVGMTDLDGDGHQDFLDDRMVFFGDGTATDPQIYQPLSQYGALDWEGDGDLDLPQERGELLRNDGRGVFGSEAMSWPPAPSSHLFGGGEMLADFDGDGLREALVPLFDTTLPYPVFVRMHRFEEDGQGHFVDQGPATALGANQLRGPAFAIDTNGDGVLDVVDRNGVWANSGAHTFVLQPTSFQGYFPMQHGDIDGDGDEDLIGGWNGTTQSLALLRLIGPHVFQVVVFAPAAGNYAPRNQPVLADLDGDGDLDVAVDDEQFGSALRVFSNQGGVLSLAYSLLLPAELDFTTAMAGDVDGDGRTDLGLGNSDELWVFRRNGPGFTYDPPRRYRIWGAAGFADLDQDGDLDVVGTTTSFGRRFDGPSAGQRRQYGLAAAGTGGRRMVLGCAGPIRSGLTATLRVREALGGTFSLLAVGGAEASTPSPVLPTLIHYTLPIITVLGFVMPGAPGQAGAGQLDIPIAIPPGFAGTTLFFQHFTFDVAAPEGIAHSNGLEFTIGG